MDSKSLTCQGEAEAYLAVPGAPRALLFSLSAEGQPQYQPLRDEESVLNINTELMQHIEASHKSIQWLTDLRDYLDQRLAARKIVEGVGGGVTIIGSDGLRQILPTPIHLQKLTGITRSS